MTDRDSIKEQPFFFKDRRDGDYMRYLRANQRIDFFLFGIVGVLALFPAGAWSNPPYHMGDDGSGMNHQYIENFNMEIDGGAEAGEGAADNPAGAAYNPDGRMFYVAATGSATRNVVTVQWETRTEPWISGYFVWRSDARDDSYVRIHHSMILSRGGISRGGFYSFDDYGVVSGRIYYYKIQEIGESGTARFYGPVASDGSIDWDKSSDKGRVNISCFIGSLFS